jgi:mandelate racemase
VDGRRIVGVRARAVNLVPQRPTETAAGTMATTPLVLVDVTVEGEVTGHAYLRTYTPAGLAPLAALVTELGTLVTGGPAAPLAVEAALRHRLRLLGTVGLTGMAMAGLDMALWDARARALAVPLATLLGGEPRPVPAYASLRTMAPAEAADEAAALVTAGFTAVKLKLGRADLAADLAAVRAVRTATGAAVTLMVDYNQCLTVPEAIRRIRVLDGGWSIWTTWARSWPSRCGSVTGRWCRRGGRAPGWSGTRIAWPAR